MPLLANLIIALQTAGIGIWLSVKTSVYALRLAVGLSLAGAYALCVGGFSAFISPLLSLLFNTQFGQFIGLAFPPIAGTVLSGYVTLWGCIVLKRYYAKMAAVILPS